MSKKHTGLVISPPKAADAFVSGAATVEPRPQAPDTGHQTPAPRRQTKGRAGAAARGAAETTAEPVSGQKMARGVVARAGGEAKRRIAAYVDVAMGEKFRRYCLDNDLEMSEVAGEAIVRYMEAEGIVAKRAR